MSIRYADGFIVVDDLYNNMVQISKTDFANNDWLSSTIKLEKLLKEANSFFISYSNERTFSSSLYWSNFIYVNSLLTFNYGLSIFNNLTLISPTTPGYDQDLIKVNRILGIAAMIFPSQKNQSDYLEILNEIEAMMDAINNALNIMVPSLKDSLIASPLTLEENLEHLKYSIKNADIPS